MPHTPYPSELLPRLVELRAACSNKDVSPYCSYRFLTEADLSSGRYELQELMKICLRCKEVELASSQRYESYSLRQ